MESLMHISLHGCLPYHDITLRGYILSKRIILVDSFCRFYAKVSDLHSEVYSGPSAAMANPLVAFTLIKRLQSEWLNLIYSDEAQENTQGCFPLRISLKTHLVLTTDIT